MKHEVKQPLRLENGTFMRGEVEVPIEIGNAEQIALLQKIERDMRIREKDAKAGKDEAADDYFFVWMNNPDYSRRQFERMHILRRVAELKAQRR